MQCSVLIARECCSGVEPRLAELRARGGAAAAQSMIRISDDPHLPAGALTWIDVELLRHLEILHPAPFIFFAQQKYPANADGARRRPSGCS